MEEAKHLALLELSDDAKSIKGLSRLLNITRSKAVNTYVHTPDAIDFLRLIIHILCNGSTLDERLTRTASNVREIYSTSAIPKEVLDSTIVKTILRNLELLVTSSRNTAEMIPEKGWYSSGSVERERLSEAVFKFLTDSLGSKPAPASKRPGPPLHGPKLKRSADTAGPTPAVTATVDPTTLHGLCASTLMGTTKNGVPCAKANCKWSHTIPTGATDDAIARAKARVEQKRASHPNGSS